MRWLRPRTRKFVERLACLSSYRSIQTVHRKAVRRNSDGFSILIKYCCAILICGIVVCNVAIKSFKNKETEEINYGNVSKQNLKLLPGELHLKAQIKLARLGAAMSVHDLRDLRGNRLESLKGDRAGQYSIRINDQYRICFRWEGKDAYDVEITDYH